MGKGAHDPPRAASCRDTTASIGGGRPRGRDPLRGRRPGSDVRTACSYERTGATLDRVTADLAQRGRKPPEHGERFVILAFPGKILPDTLYIENAFGGSDTAKDEEVRRAKVKFERLLAFSLDEA